MILDAIWVLSFFFPRRHVRVIRDDGIVGIFALVRLNCEISFQIIAAAHDEYSMEESLVYTMLLGGCLFVSVWQVVLLAYHTKCQPQMETMRKLCTVDGRTEGSTCKERNWYRLFLYLWRESERERVETECSWRVWKYLSHYDWWTKYYSLTSIDLVFLFGFGFVVMWPVYLFDW